MKPKTPKSDLDAPELYFNRELSWLEFNDRVLREGMSADVPLMERLKFLAIVASNLDEFFMIRVASLKQAAAHGGRPDFSGMTPQAQLAAIHARVARMTREHSAAIREVLDGLAGHGLCLGGIDRLGDEQKRFLRSYFGTNVLPVLTPLGFDDLKPPPLLPGLKTHLALLLRPIQGKAKSKAKTKAAPAAGKAGAAADDAPLLVSIVPVPGGLPQFVTTPADKGICLVRLDEIIGANAESLIPGYRIEACTAFRLIRDADVAVKEEDAAELLEAMQEAVLERRRRAVVRLMLSAGCDPRLRQWLIERTGLAAEEVYEVEGILDASLLMQVALRPGFEALKYPDWPAQRARDLLGQDDLWATLREQDVLLFHPYESFDPVVQLMNLAADDPDVLAIKQTLYRTSGESPLVPALIRAAENGKQVTVLVELKARFDEVRNVHWARQLEDAGCYVIYGIAGYKTHAKALLIVRREAHRIRRYLHLSTGNYNDRTARLYSDVALITSDADLTGDAAALFNLLTGYSQAVGWSKLSIAPTGLRQRFLDLIDREVQASTPDRPGLIMAKLNSLQDRRICKALYAASRAGVRVLLNIRGICCLRPGLPGVSENIEVVSIVDRYLEHSRIFYFRNGGHDEIYLSSADWMLRNLDKRLEVMFPIQQSAAKKRLLAILNTFFADNVKARRLMPDGQYQPVPAEGEPVRAQERFYREVVEAARIARQPILEFRPLTSPEP